MLVILPRKSCQTRRAAGRRRQAKQTDRLFVPNRVRESHGQSLRLGCSVSMLSAVAVEVLHAEYRDA
jgi:hypothetical protein